MDHSGSTGGAAGGMTRTWRLALRLVAAGLLAATGAIHLDLYLTGYRTIPTIGWLFLLQVISAFVLAAALLATAAAAQAGRLTAAAAAGFSLATLLGYLLSIWVGLFGFREIRTTAGIVAGVIEIAAFATSAIIAAQPVHGTAAAPAKPGGSMRDRLSAPIPWAGRGVAVLTVAALVLLAVAVAGTGGTSTATASGGKLTTEKVGGQLVLANAKGYTLYTFAPDKINKSVCYGACASYWPPVPGKPAAGTGITGTIGSIKRTDGSAQATYNGHPLYTYIGDNGSPGKASGNDINLNGGLWHVVPVSG